MMILKILKSKLPAKIKEHYEDTSLDVFLCETATKIKNHCNITEIPEELNHTWVNMTRDLIIYEYNLLHIEPTDEEKQGEVSSIKEGDSTISFGGTDKSERAKIIGKRTMSLDDLIFNYKSDLNKFRRVRW